MIKVLTEMLEKDCGSYPKLMVDNDNSMVVLMRSERVGTILGNPTICYEIGDSSSYWHMSCFSDYTGFITLRNDS